jgi:hypothetical protein
MFQWMVDTWVAIKQISFLYNKKALLLSRPLILGMPTTTTTTTTKACTNFFPMKKTAYMNSVVCTSSYLINPSILLPIL